MRANAEHGPLRPQSQEIEEGRFPDTRWSLVAQAGSDLTVRQRALEVLCQAYWQPIYTFMRGRGRCKQDAEDLTQALLVSLITREDFDGLSAEQGRFRSFLMKAASHFLSKDREFRLAQKRGGAVEHVSIDSDAGESCFLQLHGNGESPEVLFERQWAMQLLNRVMAALVEIYAREGKGEIFEHLRPMVAANADCGDYAELATAIGVSEPSLRMMVFRMRKRYRSLLREEIAQTVADPSEIDDEINHLFRVFESG
jgi:DNA-directed RNA polymerase specialized sigma24 family protein